MKDIYFDGYDRADVVEYKVGFLKRMDAYQKRSHLFFRSSVHDARVKYMFSEEDIQAFVLPQENCDVVEIPIDKFDFDRNSMEYGGKLLV